MIDNMTHKYISQKGEKYAILEENWFTKIYFSIYMYEQKPQAASHSWSAVHKHDTLTTELW